MTWNRWRSGTYRLHLRAGTAITFTGRIRFDAEMDGFTNYEVDSRDFTMWPEFAEVVAIEQLPEPGGD